MRPLNWGRGGSSSSKSVMPHSSATRFSLRLQVTRSAVDQTQSANAKHAWATAAATVRSPSACASASDATAKTQSTRK